MGMLVERRADVMLTAKHALVLRRTRRAVHVRIQDGDFCVACVSKYSPPGGSDCRAPREGTAGPLA